MKIGESSFILLVELRNGSRINKELKFLFAWALYHMKGCLETWYHDVKPTRSFPLNSRKLLRTCDWPESFGSSSGRWTKIQSFLKSLLILNPWQASQSIPIEVVYEKEGFLYKKEGVSIVMRNEKRDHSKLCLGFKVQSSLKRSCKGHFWYPELHQH